MIEKFGVQWPELKDLPARPRGIVSHWTGGTHKANAVDLAAYHAVFEGDGTVKLGKHPIAANMRVLSTHDEYAAHTGGYNSFRVGVSLAGMREYKGPDSLGSHPLTEVQVKRMCEAIGFLCNLWELDPLNPSHNCTHREVWTIHRIKGTRNHQKRDIEFLPFAPHLTPVKVGDWLRTLAKVRASPLLEESIEITAIPPLVKKRVYSEYLKEWLIPVVVESDKRWEYVKFSDVLALPRTRAGTPLSEMPEKPE